MANDVEFYSSMHTQLEACIKEHGPEYFQSKGHTTAVGLVNQGATCYLNSLMQALFHVKQFREAVFAWRYDIERHGDVEAHCIPLQLQRLFAKLALCTAPFVGTSGLTTSFGWEGEDAFMQHDVQELCRVLFEALSLSDNGEFSTFLTSLFGGTTEDTLACDTCGHSRVRAEQWQDLSLPVEGLEPACSPSTGLHASLRSLSTPEVLAGSNAWHCEGCRGLSTRAVKRTTIATPLPNVLTLHLRRFGYDAATGRYVKLGGAFSFPMSISSSAFTSSSSPSLGEDEYELCAVLLHAGGATKGHYFAFVKPELRDAGGCSSSAGEGEGEGKWLLANDTGVTAHTSAQVAAAIGATLPPSPGPTSTEGAAGGCPAPKVPVGATPYLLLYRRQREVSTAPHEKPAPLSILGRAGEGGDGLRVQYDHAAALGAGLLPPAEQEAVHASNLTYSALHRAATLKPCIATLSVHVPMFGSNQEISATPTLKLRPTYPMQRTPRVRAVPLQVHVRYGDSLADVTRAVHGAWMIVGEGGGGVGAGDVRLRRFDPATIRPGEPLPPSPTTALEAGLCPSATLMLQSRPSGAALHHRLDADGWPAWAEDAITLRLLPWGGHTRARAGRTAAAASGKQVLGGDAGAGQVLRWGDLPVVDTLCFDQEAVDGSCSAPCSALATCTIITLVPSIAGPLKGSHLSESLSAVLPPHEGPTMCYAIVVPGGVPEAEEASNGQAAARLRMRAGAPAPTPSPTCSAVPGGLRVLTLSLSPRGEGGAGGGGEWTLGTDADLQDGDDLLLIPSAAAPGMDLSPLPPQVEDALTAIRSLFVHSALKLDVRTSPSLTAALAAASQGVRGALARALHAWAAAVPGSVLELSPPPPPGEAGGEGACTWLSSPADAHVFMVGAGPSSGSGGCGEGSATLGRSMSVVARRDDSLVAVKARALASALGGSLFLPHTARLPSCLPPLPVHIRRGPRAPAFKSEDEEGRSLGEVDVGDGAGLLLCPGEAMSASVCSVRLWAWVGPAPSSQGSGGGSGGMVLLGALAIPLSSRILNLKKAALDLLTSRAILPSSPALQPGNIRLRSKPPVGDSLLLRDDAVVRTLTPAPALISSVQALTPGPLPHLPHGTAPPPGPLAVHPSRCAPWQCVSSGEERDVAVQVLPAPESIGRGDIILRVRQLVCPPGYAPAAGVGSAGPDPHTILSPLYAACVALDLVQEGTEGGPWLDVVDLPAPAEGPRLSPPEDIVLSKGTSVRSLARALAGQASPAQRALLQLAALEAGEAGEIALVPLPIRLARVSALGPSCTVYDALRTVSWRGPVCVSQDGGEGEGDGLFGDTPVLAAPLSLTDGCTLLWRCDPMPTGWVPPPAPPQSAVGNKENEGGREEEGGPVVAGSGLRAVASRRASAKSQQGDNGSTAECEEKEKPWLAARKAKAASAKAGLPEGCGAAREDVVVLAGRPPQAVPAPSSTSRKGQEEAQAATRVKEGHHKSGESSASRDADVRHGVGADPDVQQGPLRTNEAQRFDHRDKAFIGNISGKELGRLQAAEASISVSGPHGLTYPASLGGAVGTRNSPVGQVGTATGHLSDMAAAGSGAGRGAQGALTAREEVEEERQVRGGRVGP